MPYKVIGGKATQVKYSSDEVFSRIKHEGIKFIDLQFTGLTGRFHHTTSPSWANTGGITAKITKSRDKTK